MSCTVSAGVRGPYPLLFFLFSLGLGLRLWGLGAESLWYDELFSWWITDGSLDQVFARTREDTGPPGHHVLLFMARQVFGSSEAALRLPAALLGALAVPAMFSLGRKLYGVREGVLAAALLAVAQVPVAYSQEARAYSGMLCLAAVASSAWVTLLRDLERGSPRASRVVAYLLSALALAYFHYFGIVLVGLQAIGAFVEVRRSPPALLRALLIYLSIAAACMPWLPSFSAQVEGGMGNIGWIAEATPAALVGLARFLFNGAAAIAVPAYSLIVIYLLVALRRRSSWRLSLADPDFLLVCWLIVPVLVTYTVSSLWVPIFKNRYLLIVAPAAYLLLARALVALLGTGRLVPRAVPTLVVAALLFHLIVVRGYYTALEKPALREGVAYALEQTPPGAAVYLLSRGWNAWMFDYYLEHREPGARLVGASAFGRRVDRASLLRVRQALARSVMNRAEAASATHIWVFEARPGSSSTLTDAVDAELELVGSKRLHGLSVSVHARR